MLIAGIAACCAGVLQFFLNTRMFPAIFAGNYKKAGVAVFLKLAVYALGIWLLIAFFRAYLTGAAIGFGAGFGAYFIVYAIRSVVKKDG